MKLNISGEIWALAFNFGAVEDLQIYHDGSDSYIKDTGSGNLLIQYSDLYFSKDAGSTHSVVFRSTGNVGIGTTSPGADLDIQNSNGATLFMDDTNGRSLNLRTANNSTQYSNHIALQEAFDKISMYFIFSRISLNKQFLHNATAPLQITCPFANKRC